MLWQTQCISKATAFPVVMCGCESWTIKNAVSAKEWTFSNCSAGEDSWEVPWTARRSNQSILKKNQPWIFIGRTDAEAPILWPPDTKSQFVRKDPEAGKDWKQNKRAADDEMVRQYHQLNEHGFEQTPGDSGGQRSQTCHSPCVCIEMDST